MTLPAVVRLPWTFPAEELAAEVRALADEDWVPHFNTGIYEGGWDTATLRAPVGGVGSLSGYPDPTATGFAPTELLDRCPAAAAVLAAIPATLLSARFLRLGPGAEIREHRDHMLGHAHGEVRLHVGVYAYRHSALIAYADWPVGPLETWEGLEQLRFMENGSDVHCVTVEAEGRAFWELNNPSDVPRIDAILRQHGLP